MRNPKATGRIKITKTPEGEAPKWVRSAWVGLVLPCASRTTCTLDPDTGRHDLRGVLSGKQVEPGIGFLVPTDLAVAALAKKNPRAAQWWRDHGYPQKGGAFHFRESEAEALEGVQSGALVDDMETGRWEVPGMR